MATTRASAGGKMRSDAPLGRHEVVAAILEAAAELFAERGPAATSIRDIAAKSNVNHGLVFRHFGAKEKLIGAVLDDLSTKVTASIDAGATSEEVEAAIDRHWRVVARALLDGYPAAELQTSFPTISRLFETIRRQHSSEDTARMAVANAVALQLGWRMFEPFLRIATGIESTSNSELQDAITTETARILEPQHQLERAEQSD